MPDWHGLTGRDDLVGGNDETQFSTTIDGVTLCSVEPFTDNEVAALREYFRLLKAKRAAACGPYETPEVFTDPVTCPCGLKTRPGSCGWCEE